MEVEEYAARVLLVEQVDRDFRLELDGDEVARWVFATEDMPLGWVKVGVEKLFARFVERRRPRPGDLREAARSVCGAVYVERDGSGYHSNERWPPEDDAILILRERRVSSGVAPSPTTLPLSRSGELQVESGTRERKPTPIAASVETALQSLGVPSPQGGDTDGRNS